MTERKPGPYNNHGMLHYKLTDGSSISCTCLGTPYVDMVVEASSCESRQRIHDLRVTLTAIYELATSAPSDPHTLKAIRKAADRALIRDKIRCPH